MMMYLSIHDISCSRIMAYETQRCSFASAASCVRGVAIAFVVAGVSMRFPICLPQSIAFFVGGRLRPGARERSRGIRCYNREMRDDLRGLPALNAAQESLIHITIPV